MAIRVADIAERFGLTLQGEGGAELVGVCTLESGAPDRLAYLADPDLTEALAATAAGAVILPAELAERCPVPALVTDQPRLAYARAAALFEPAPPAPGVAGGAHVDAGAEVDPAASIAAGAVVSAGARVAAGAVLAPGCIIGRDAEVGRDCHIGPNAVIGDRVRLGERVRIGGGAVLGDRGFGLVPDAGQWIGIPQLGGVAVGDDVEVGAGCTIDRGAIDDTVLEEGVKLDDQVHVAHNCRIGAHSLIAGCTGIAGSSRIGRGCMIGGGVGIGDHVTIADGVVITGATQVPGDIAEPGVYSSTLWPMPAREWSRRLALLRKLDRTEKRLRALERALQDKGEQS